ncbi:MULTISPECIES: hypothetical protein [Pseudoalteromonas]|uniref:Uncharacterized protein n=1 Tax=Pseudoalteromonas piscicida TaxID=43662 RepID=A0ABM6NG44_PSEO7|nr:MULTISPECIES: hypothetical protein [Pseudoalteromonas]ATD07821.1 hypothetical protein PPIS_a2938 [Pseudoalteromonas piscicida]WPU34409.1 hypothetical protein SIO17_12305 [Pseudoalteromonas piscicida]
MQKLNLKECKKVSGGNIYEPNDPKAAKSETPTAKNEASKKD